MPGILTLTHSGRTTNFERCSVQFLERRFGDPGRLAALPPFESLGPAEVLYSGAVSFVAVGTEPGHCGAFRLLGSVKRRQKVQHAVVVGEREVLVGFEQKLERWRLTEPLVDCGKTAEISVEIVSRFEHPHLVGVHTVAPLGGARAAVSCSGSDAVLVVDLAEGRLERTLRMPPAIYGEGYAPTPERDFRRHYPKDEYQATHVNAASASADGRRLAVSTLIQGAVGIFDLESGGYHEVVRGFVGCHGTRWSAEGELYLADSTSGQLVFLSAEGGIARRFAVPSRWLHDVQQIEGSLYAFALADLNEIHVYDVATGDFVWGERFATRPEENLEAAFTDPAWLGNSVQALAYVSR